MGLVQSSAPATWPVTLDEAKFQCRVDGTKSDLGLQALIEDATDKVEAVLGRSLMAQTWQLTLDEFADEIVLPRGPVAAAPAITYLDEDGASQPLSSDLYEVDLTSDPQRIVRRAGASWPSTADRVNAVTITYTANYTAVPRRVKRAILLLIATWYDDRTADVPQAVYSLVRGSRDLPG